MHLFLLFFNLGMLLLLAGAAALVWHMAVVPHGNVLYGVSLPPDVLGSEAVRALRGPYRRLCAGFLALLVGSYLPVFLLLLWLPRHIILSFDWMMVWTFTAFLLALNRPLIYTRRRLLAVKRGNGWFCGEPRVAEVDTRAALSKNTRALPAWWFALPAGLSLCALALLTGGSEAQMLLILGAASLFTQALFFALYVQTKRLRARIYCADAERNAAANSERQRILTRLWFLFACIDSAGSLLLRLFIRFPSLGGMLAASALEPLAALAVVLWGWRALRRNENAARAAEGLFVERQAGAEALMDSDDDVWKESLLLGLVYCNPDDQNTWVEKRIGAGVTVNMATRGGKAFIGGILGGAVLLTAALMAVLTIADFSYTGIRFEQSAHRVQIEDFLYGTSFADADIQSVTLVQNVPVEMRTNGSDDGTRAVGHFTVQGIGEARLYLYENKPPYIHIVLKSGGDIFYNESTPAATQELFARLKAAQTQT